MKKNIICFANSRKSGGRCFAGKEIISKEWIRPVNLEHSELDLRTECIKEDDCPCKNRKPEVPKLLDIIEINLNTCEIEDHQVENAFVEENKKWKHIGVLSFNEIDDYIDDVEKLWINNYQTCGRKNDRIPITLKGGVENSLVLIEVDELSIVVSLKERFGKLVKLVDGKFNYKGVEYILPITDIEIENLCAAKRVGIYTIPRNKRILLCVSLGKEYYGFIYKFIAGVILNSF